MPFLEEVLYLEHNQAFTFCTEHSGSCIMWSLTAWWYSEDDIYCFLLFLRAASKRNFHKALSKTNFGMQKTGQM